MHKHRMMTPGPTDVPSEVLLEGAKKQIHHRSVEFQRIYSEILDLLKIVFKTSRPVLPILSSGTGAMECCVANLTSLDTKPIVIEGGWFGKRWNDICCGYGLETETIQVDWGKSVEPELLEEKLIENPNCSAVFVQLCETSTGAVHPIQELQEICSKKGVLLVVDGISGVGAEKCETDEWNLDAVIAGSQKAFMNPPGLSYITLSNRAWNAVRNSKHTRFYFDLRKYLDGYEKKNHPFTPPTSLLHSQLAALKMISDEGIDNSVRRHSLLASATRAGVKALGLKLFAEHPANSVTSVWMPEGLDSSLFIKKLMAEEGVTIAGAQGPWKGKFFRIGHLGFVDSNDIILTLSAIERVLKKMGVVIELGAGITAAQNILVKKGEYK